MDTSLSQCSLPSKLYTTTAGFADILDTLIKTVNCEVKPKIFFLIAPD